MGVSNPAPPRIGGPIVGGTSGAVLFVDTTPILAQDINTLVFDNVNKFLGVNVGAPVFPLHAQKTITATSGTTSVVRASAPANPASASSGFHAALYVTSESAAGTTQNYSNVITGSFYEASHRSSGTCTNLRGMTANLAQVAGAGAVTVIAGVHVLVSIAGSVTNSAQSISSNVAVTATGALADWRGFMAANPNVLAGGAITNCYGAYVLNQGMTGVTNAYGCVIAAQSGAATRNYGLVIGATTAPSGSAALYIAAGNVQFVGGVNVVLSTTTGTKIGTGTTQLLGFFNATPVVQQTATGSRGGNAALASLLTALANLGLVADATVI